MMQMRWSHSVINVRDMARMIEFYKQVLGFAVSDRGPVGPEDGPEIVFLTQQPGEHHQLAFLDVRKDSDRPNSLNHMAFRVTEFEDVQQLYQVLSELDGAKPAPISHGNTLSVYFSDPEGNGIEVFWDTPWHVAQPQGKPWDPSLDKDAAVAWVRDTFEGEASFVDKAAWLREVGA